jgi:hypothetical protein
VFKAKAEYFMTVIVGAILGGLIGYFVWYFAPTTLKGREPSIKVPDLDALPSPAEPAQASNKRRGFFVAGLGILAIVWFCLSLAAAAFLLALIYGVVVLVFRAAFGVELPNPF